MKKHFGKIGIVINTISFVIAGFAAFISLAGLVPAIILSLVALMGTRVGANLGARRTALFSLLTVSSVFVFILWANLPLRDSNLTYISMIIVMFIVSVILFRNYRVSRSTTD
jgi:hypothetical protein